MRHADWIVDVGPDAGEQGGHVLYSGPPEGLRHVRLPGRRATSLASRHRAQCRPVRLQAG